MFLLNIIRVQGFANLILRHKKVLLFIDWRKNIVYTCIFLYIKTDTYKPFFTECNNLIHDLHQNKIKH